MRCLILVIALVALAIAAPKKQTGFRNLYIEATSGKPHPHPRIIGGQVAEPHSIPWQAFIEGYSNTESWYCGASLISQTHLLTAAHCLQDESDQLAVVVAITLGAHRVFDREDTQETLGVITEGLLVHPGYDSSVFINDIGLIKMPKAVSLTEAIAVVPLPVNADNDYVGAAARVSGWGITEGHQTRLSQVLNVLNTSIIANDECNEQMGGGYIKSNNICITGEQNTGACFGDFGGPLTVDGVQVGVGSFGIRFCPPGYPSAFTRVTEYLDWIHQSSDVELV